MWEENLLSRYNCNVYIVYTDDWIINVIDVKKEILRFFRTFLHTFYVSLFHNFIVLSFSSAADAIIFSVGWHAVHKTVSVCPCKRCTMSLLCKFQMYTKLSSLPDTIHCRRKQNVIKMLHVAKSSLFFCQYYLAAGYGKIGENAVFLIFVAGICFQAFSLWIVP